ncbi:MAG: dTDP-4-dehydrorhamnose 3,5-epimerase [Ardenticatenaceae bacterium]|nr:dTDP-4-dehydrorhamnose 3,5-epimerase [Ardenticatenaceae bacterium]
MIFQKTIVPNAFVIDIERLEDSRGFFARSWCVREFEAHGLNPQLVQCNISFNQKKGTLRGLHFQTPPFAEAKLVRCTRGAIYDVIVDIRPDSAAYLIHIGVTLSAENRTMLYVPEGCLHGFLTLTDDVEVCYQMSEFYSPACSRGYRWNDPAFAIEWPGEITVISEKDQQYPDFVLEHRHYV